MEKGRFLVFISRACNDCSLGSQFKTSGSKSGQKWVSAQCLPGRRASCLPSGLPFPFIFCPCVFYCGCGIQKMIWVLSNQVEITAKSPGQERWNPTWTFGHHFFRSTVNICLKYDLSRPGETCRCANDLLGTLGVADFGT